jgi:hypothetical protein
MVCFRRNQTGWTLKQNILPKSSVFLKTHEISHAKIAGSIYFIILLFSCWVHLSEVLSLCTKRVVLSQNSLTKFIMCELQQTLTSKLRNVDSSLLDNLTRPATYIHFMKGHNIKQSPYFIGHTSLVTSHQYCRLLRTMGQLFRFTTDCWRTHIEDLANNFSVSKSLSKVFPLR